MAAVLLYAPIGISLAACVTDVKERRIPNVLTFGATIAALVFHLIYEGQAGLMIGLGGWFIGLLLFFPFFALGGMGAGDVKLLAALGAWVGPREAFWLAIYTSLAGGVIGVAVALARGYLLTALRNVWTLLVSWFLTGPRPMPSMTLADSKAPRLAYAIPMFVGTMVLIWLRR